ncbi:MAG: peptidylprolyl isomerase [Polyangiaceae bacterium]
MGRSGAARRPVVLATLVKGSLLRLGLGLLSLGVLAACDDKALTPAPAPSASAAQPRTLSPELAAKPIATVGDRVITLGDYAATIERMDQFERLRYQSEDRRKQLLDEMIKVELLSREARKRGLDQKPETKARIRQILRDELLRTVRAELPAPGDVPEAEVRAYYDKHKAEYRDPERRRVAHIVVADKAKATQLLSDAKKASPMQWGQLVQDHSLDKPPKPSVAAPLELAGDLGIVSAPGVEKGDNPRVPAAVRKAVFEIAAVGGVYDGVVEADGKFHIVRLTGKTDARERSFAEAERSIRVQLVQDKLEKLEQDLEKQLRERFKVTVDEKALDKIAVPGLEPSGGSPPPQK